MRVGVSIGTSSSTDGPHGQREGPRAVLSQAQAANRAALDTLTLGDQLGPDAAAWSVELAAEVRARLA